MITDVLPHFYGSPCMLLTNAAAHLWTTRVLLWLGVQDKRQHQNLRNWQREFWQLVPMRV